MTYSPINVKLGQLQEVGVAKRQRVVKMRYLALHRLKTYSTT